MPGVGCPIDGRTLKTPPERGVVTNEDERLRQFSLSRNHSALISLFSMSLTEQQCCSSRVVSQLIFLLERTVLPDFPLSVREY